MSFHWSEKPGDRFWRDGAKWEIVDREYAKCVFGGLSHEMDEIDSFDDSDDIHVVCDNCQVNKSWATLSSTRLCHDCSELRHKISYTHKQLDLIREHKLMICGDLTWKEKGE